MFQVGEQHAQTSIEHRELAVFGKLKVALCGRNFGSRGRNRDDAASDPDQAGTLSGRAAREAYSKSSGGAMEWLYFFISNRTKISV